MRMQLWIWCLWLYVVEVFLLVSWRLFWRREHSLLFGLHGRRCIFLSLRLDHKVCGSNQVTSWGWELLWLEPSFTLFSHLYSSWLMPPMTVYFYLTLIFSLTHVSHDRVLLSHTYLLSDSCLPWPCTLSHTSSTVTPNNPYLRNIYIDLGTRCNNLT